MTNDTYTTSGDVRITIKDDELTNEYNVSEINDISVYIDYFEEAGLPPEVDFKFTSEDKSFCDENGYVYDDIQEKIKEYIFENGYIAAIENGEIEI